MLNYLALPILTYYPRIFSPQIYEAVVYITKAYNYCANLRLLTIEYWIPFHNFSLNFQSREGLLGSTMYFYIEPTYAWVNVVLIP